MARVSGGTTMVAVAAALVAAVAMSLVPASRAEIAATDPFVRVDGMKFKLGDEDFLFVGFNAYQLTEGTGDWGPIGKYIVKDIMETARENGMSVMRTFGFAGRLEENAVQIAPGEYNEKMLEGLDYVLAQAAKFDIRVVLVIDNYWDTSLDKDQGGANGITRYLDWMMETQGVNVTIDEFFTNEECKRMYKDHINFLLNRVNTVNGRVYKDDPAIMSYNVLNEPRCPGCGKDLQAWIDEMAAYIRSIDGNHLITVGEDGFYSEEFETSDARRLGMNPGEWANGEGQDFIANHAGKDISYAGIHIWPDDWNHREVRYQHDWILQHIEDAERVLKKPFVLEEFGKTKMPGEGYEIRDRFMGAAFKDAEENVNKGGALQGTSWWNLYDRGGGKGDGYAIYLSDDSTFGVIREHAAKMAEAAERLNRGESAGIAAPYETDEDFASMYGLFSANGEVRTIAGVPGQAGHADGEGAASLFRDPHGLAVTADGKVVFVADKANHVVRAVDVETGETTTVAGVPGEAGMLDGPAGSALFDQPVAVAVPGSGLYILVADSGNNVVRKIDLKQGRVSTFQKRDTGRFGMINSPQGIACDAQCGSVLLVDSGNSRVLDVGGEEVRLVAGAPEKGWEHKGFDDGVGPNATFSYPLNGALTLDGRTAVVASNDNTAMRKVDMVTGEVSTLAGDGKDGKRDSGNIFAEPARFRWPMGVAMTPDGKYAIVADQYNHRVRAVDAVTGEVTTVAGWVRGFQDGKIVSRDTNEAEDFVDARFNIPRGVAVHSVGGVLKVFVSDSGNQVIREVTVELGGDRQVAETPADLCPEGGCYSSEELAVRGVGK